MTKYNNVCYTGQPKGLDSKGRKSTCFVPAVQFQQGVEKNYIVVCCSPSFNGVWEWKVEDKDKCSLWNNNGRKCLYVPQSICQPIKLLEDIDTFEVRKYIAEQQQKGYEYAKPKDVPDWFLINRDEDLQKEFPNYARLKEKK